jgi:hypothetical protein
LPRWNFLAGRRVLHDPQGQGKRLGLAVRHGQGCRRPRSDIPSSAARGRSEQFGVGDMIGRGDDQLVQHPARTIISTVAVKVRTRTFRTYGSAAFATAA